MLHGLLYRHRAGIVCAATGVPGKAAACVCITVQSQLSEHTVVSVLPKVCLPLGVGSLVCKLVAMEITLETQVTSRQGTSCEDGCCVGIPSELKQSIQLKLRK